MPGPPGETEEQRAKRKAKEAAASGGGSSSSSSKEKTKSAKERAAEKQAEGRKYAAKAKPDTVLSVVDPGDVGKEYFTDGDWGPAWAPIEFDDDACLKNVTKAGKAADGYFVPAGSMLPLGAVMPPMTVLKYGGYFPAGTSFRGGVLVPIHARMVNILPQEAKEATDKWDEPLCLVQ